MQAALQFTTAKAARDHKQSTPYIYIIYTSTYNWSLITTGAISVYLPLPFPIKKGFLGRLNRAIKKILGWQMIIYRADFVNPFLSTNFRKLPTVQCSEECISVLKIKTSINSRHTRCLSPIFIAPTGRGYLEKDLWICVTMSSWICIFSHTRACLDLCFLSCRNSGN